MHKFRRLLVLAFAAAFVPSMAALAADLTVTAANVAAVNGTVEHGTAGEAVTAGQALYKKASDNKMYKADNNVTVAEAQVVGVALHSTSTAQPISYQVDGLFNPGATVVVGTTYVLSANAGGIAPVADLVATNRLTYIGYGETVTGIRLMIKATGIVLP